MIEKVLIDNRGEIALRIFKTCQKLGIGAVIAYSSKDAHSLPVREALKAGIKDARYGAVLVGGDTSADSYEDIPGVIAAAKAYGCDAVHPGYGFLSERADAAEAMSKAGLIFIGPTDTVIRQVGNKAAARELAQTCNVPLMTASPLVHRFAEVTKHSKAVGYPFVLKADIGGGGMNNLFVKNEAELKEKFENFSLRNPGGFYIEKKLEKARHIELQLAADTKGNVVILGERDCSAQRKAQKVIEEAPAVIAPESVLVNMRHDAISMAKKVSYTGVGTWEFLYDPATKHYYFMEINPRIQVEHTVTEMCYENLDIVAWQLAIANGQILPEIPKKRDGYVMQLRLYAEDPRNDFRQSPGTLAVLQFPKTDENVRIDRGYDQGDSIPASLDSTIAKLIVNGTTREETRQRALQTLNDTTISGITTNRDFLRWLLATPEVINNTHWTTFMEEAWAAEQKKRFTEIARFFEHGTFEEQTLPTKFDAKNYLQDITYERRGVKRKYSEDLKTCAFRYGIYKDESGVELAVGYWDFSVMGGTLGSEEGAAVAALFKLAHQKHLSVVTVTTSSGARQQEGAKALEMMDVIVAARWQYQPPLYINVYSGLNFGGVTVSLAESADISISLTGSKIGFAGPDLVAHMMGKKSGADLEAGAHSAEDAYTNRSVDLVVEGLQAAAQHAVSLCGTLTKNMPRYDQPLFQSVIPTNRFDRPATERVATLIGALDERSLTAEPKKHETKTVSQKRQLINDPSRFTAADILNPAFGVFESMSPLSVRMLKDGTETYPSIIGALGRINKQSVMVLGQQTQRRLSDKLEKVYIAPSARDFRWALRKIELAQHLQLPIIMLCDTTGGDASLASEADGVGRAIADLLSIFYQPRGVTVPVITSNIGENGSGGGLTFGRLLDASADFENALTFVATPEAQVKILTDNWAQGDKDIANVINQLNDATVQGRLKLQQVDAVISETNPAKGLRAFITNQLGALTKLSSDELLTRRFKRVEQAGNIGLVETKENPKPILN